LLSFSSFLSVLVGFTTSPRGPLFSISVSVIRGVWDPWSETSLLVFRTLWIVESYLIREEVDETIEPDPELVPPALHRRSRWTSPTLS